MIKLQSNTSEWWDELNHLTQLLMEWHAERENKSLRERVLESMEKLGFVVAVGDQAGESG